MFRLHPTKYSLDRLQKTALSLMTLLALITFLGTNLQAVLWQSSDWLVGTVLPAVVVELTNEEREDENAAPLTRNTQLDKAAKLKAKHMAENEYFSHYAPDGTSPWHWFNESGYVYAHAGENLAIHFTDSSEVVEAWMDSPTHRGNIVDPKYTEIGVGTAKGEYEGYDTVYVVQLFGTPGVTSFASIEPESEPTPLPELESVPVLVETPEPDVTPLAVAEETTSPNLPETPEVLADEEDLETLIPNEPVVANEELITESGIEPETISEPVSAPVLVTQNPANNSVIIERPVIATSSGLAVANFTEPNTGQNAGQTSASLATQPNTLLQIVYMVLGLIAFVLLIASVILEARQLRFIQVSYSFFLLFGMGGLWFVHSLLTDGAVIL